MTLTDNITDLLAAVAADEPDALCILADYYEDCGSIALAAALRSGGAFLTGSHRYGIPHEKSDVDVCCMVTQSDLAELGRLHGKSSWNPQNVTCNCRIGNLNLIAASSAKFFAAWEQITDELERRKPVTKEQAVEAFHGAMTDMYGPGQPGPSPG